MGTWIRSDGFRADFARKAGARGEGGKTTTWVILRVWVTSALATRRSSTLLQLRRQNCRGTLPQQPVRKRRKRKGGADADTGSPSSLSINGLCCRRREVSTSNLGRKEAEDNL